MVESIVVPTVLYGSEFLVLNARERRRVEVSDMKYLRKVLGLWVMQRIKNRDIKKSSPKIPKVVWS